jgi:hypothetical protein
LGQNSPPAVSVPPTASFVRHSAPLSRHDQNVIPFPAHNFPYRKSVEEFIFALMIENGLSVFTAADLLIISWRNWREPHDSAIKCSQVSGTVSIAISYSRKADGSIPGELK